MEEQALHYWCDTEMKLRAECRWVASVNDSLMENLAPHFAAVIDVGLLENFEVVLPEVFDLAWNKCQ